MTPSSKKQAERAALDHLIDNVDLGIEVLGVEPAESPDFRLRVAPSGTVGVEVVELVEEDLARGMAGLKRLEASLEQELTERALNAQVYISTADGFIPKLNDGAAHRSHVAAIAKLVERHLATETARRKYERSELVQVGAKWLKWCLIEASDSPVAYSGARTSKFATGHFVQQRVDEKARKLPAYRSSVEGPVWLLLVAGRQFASGVWSESVAIRSVRSPFDRVFYVDAFDSAAFEVENVDGDSGQI